MRITISKYRQRVFRRPVFKRHLIEVLGDNLPPPCSFLFEDIVLTKKHKEEDVIVSTTRIVELYNGQNLKK